MEKAKLLIVEDHESIRKELCTFFERYGYQTEALTNFETVVEECLNTQADLILLDINLPVCDGYYVCREIRKESQIPIIVVTSRDSEMDELMSMNLGADDFITKPYNTKILLARVEALLKRTKTQNVTTKMTHKGLEISFEKSMVKSNQKEVELTKNEMKILHILIEAKDTIVSRDHIMEELWQTDEFVDDNTLTVNVNRLRKKLESIGLDHYIETKRGQGYMV